MAGSWRVWFRERGWKVAAVELAETAVIVALVKWCEHRRALTWLGLAVALSVAFAAGVVAGRS